MGAVWLHDLPAVIAAAGLQVRTWPGWEQRSRSSGGYDSVWAIGIHHTASSTTPDNDCKWMWQNSPDRPIGAMLLDRTGLVTVGAAGATNTQGKGGPWPTSQGIIPLDQGNRFMVSVEAANSGTGEPWPQVQQDAYVKLCAALVARYGLTAGDVVAHHEWARGRKIDPAGSSKWATGRNSWNMDQFRGDVFWATRPPTTPPPLPTPHPGIDDMLHTIKPFRNSDTRGFGGEGIDPQTPHRFGLHPDVFPANTAAIAMNVTVVGASLPGFMTVWPSGSMPNSSCVNWPGDGGAHSGMIVTAVHDLGFMLWLQSRAHVICDITGFWTS